LKLRHSYYIVIYFLLVIANATTISAQQKYQLKLKIADKDSTLLLRNFKPKKQSSVQECKDAYSRFLTQLHYKGYLFANVDTQYISSTFFNVAISVGKQYKVGLVTYDSATEQMMAQSGMPSTFYQKKPFSLYQYIFMKSQMLAHAEQTGFPFATVRLDSIQIEDSTIKGKIKFEKNLKITIDSVVCKGPVKLSAYFLHNYLGIKKNSVYNESFIDKINQNIASLNYVESIQPYTITFMGNHAVVNLYLKNKRASKFNFLLGLQPTPANTTQKTGSKVSLTGDGLLHLENMQGTANLLDINFKLYPGQTKVLNIQYFHPYPFGFPAGIETFFDINKQDSSFLDVSYNIGLQQLFAGNNYIKLFYKATNSTVSYIDTNLIKLFKKLPAQIDYKKKQIGISWRQENLDNRLNPTKGFTIKWTILGGIKQFEANNTILAIHTGADGFQYKSLYDTLPKNIKQGVIELQGSYYKTVIKQQVIKLAIKTAQTIDKELAANELYRIGGYKTLRGFDEQSIQASSYIVPTFEWRYLLNQNSFIGVFNDWGFITAKTKLTYSQQIVYSFGAHAAFETSAGIFEIGYGLGTNTKTAINIRSGKIHFGYVIAF
jgi:hypothetical protein